MQEVKVVLYTRHLRWIIIKNIFLNYMCLHIAVFQAGYCFIDGKCVAEGDSLETDRHKVCLPTNETFHWTHVENIG